MKSPEEDYPYDGRLEFAIDVEPVSLQAKATARQAFDEALAERLSKFDFVIDSQSSLTVHWYGVPRVRWKTDRYPDLDNWLKPLIDSFVGGDRLIVDDSLIRSVEVTWHEGLVEQSRLHVRLDFDAEHRLHKAGLRYAQFDDGMCFPIQGDLEHEAVAVLIDWGKSVLQSVKELEDLGAHSIDTWPLLSNGWIHRSRLRDFEVLSASELLRTS